MDTTCPQNGQISNPARHNRILTSRNEEPRKTTKETSGWLYWGWNGPQGLTLWQHDDDDDDDDDDDKWKCFTFLKNNPSYKVGVYKLNINM
jgi:hypothetical protein